MKILRLLTLSTLFVGAINASAQCTLYDANSIYTDLEGNLPCGADCGNAFTTSFELWSNEAYPLGELKSGSEYDFTLGASSGWNPTLTVAEWDGTTVGSVIGFVDGRNLSVTIPADGFYILTVTITGSCDGAATNGVNNGALTIDCGAGGASCFCDANIAYTTDYDCATGSVIMDVTSVDNAEVPYSIDMNGTVQTVSAIGSFTFNGMPNDVQFPLEIIADNGCDLEGNVYADSCLSGCADYTFAVADGGFEGTTWTEESLLNGNPSGFGIVDGTLSLEGAQSAWLGGFDDVSVTSVSQSFTVTAANSLNLSMWYLAGACDSPNDSLSVWVDNNRVATIIADGANCGSGFWNKSSIDLTAYADGNAHDLKIQVNTYGTNGGVTNFFVDQVMLEVCPPSFAGLTENTNIINIAIAPNPVSTESIIEINLNEVSDVEVKILDLTGKVISQTLLNEVVSVREPINVNDFAAGTYVIQVTNNGLITTKRFVVSK